MRQFAHIAAGLLASISINAYAERYECASEDTSGFTVGALKSINTAPFTAHLPICDGLIAIGNITNNKIEIINLRDGSTIKGWQLAARPTGIIYQSGYLLVSHANSYVSRINVSTGNVNTIAIPGSIRGITAGEPGQAFVMHSPASNYDGYAAIIDLASGNVLGSKLLASFLHFLAYNPATKMLASGAKGYSPSELYTFRYDPATLSFTRLQSSRDLGSNGQDLSISPDGGHLAFSVGGGNGGGYNIYDINANNLTQSFGSWITGAYPSTATFRNDGKMLLANNGTSYGATLFEFDAQTHAVNKQWPINMGACSYSGTPLARYSPGSAFGVLGVSCGVDIIANPTAMLHVVAFTAPGPTLTGVRIIGSRNSVSLTWSGLTGASVQIYADNSKYRLIANDGQENVSQKKTGTTWKVCEKSAPTVCTNSIYIQ